MESEIIADNSNLCVCPDALALKATPFADVCYKCAKRIDVTTWEHWRNIHPYNEETNWFAFGLRRDDSEELIGLPSSYFEPQLFEVLKVWEQLETENQQ
jgi:hypothetical protein